MPKRLRAVIVSVLLSAVAPFYAALTIQVCGSATSATDYTCPEGPVQSLGTDANAVKLCEGSACVFTGTKPGFAPETPSGWSSPSSPPSTTTSSTQYRAWSSGPYHVDRAAAFDYMMGEQGYVKGDAPANTTTGGSNGVGQWFACQAPITNCYATNNGKRDGDFVATAGCPAGYTLDGGTCNLTNASVVVKPQDGKCNIIRSGNSYSGDPLDPDCALGTSGGAAAALGLSVSGNTVSVTSGGASGSVVTDAATGKTVITQTTPDIAGGTTITSKTSITAPPGGTGTPTVEGTSLATTSGTGTLNTGTGEVLEVNTCGLPGKPPCAIDEGGTGSLSTSAAASKLAEGAGVLDTIKGHMESTTGGYGTGWSWLFPLAPSATCTDPGFTFKGYEFSIAICEKAPMLRSIFEWVLYIVTGVMLMSIFFREGS